MSKIRKAITGAFTALGVALVAVGDPLGPGQANVTTNEAIGLVAATVIGFATVWIVPNDPKA